MAIKPILFNTAMVQAILDGRKTVTRRLLKPQPFVSCEGLENECKHEIGFFDTGGNDWACRKCGAGIRMDGKSIYHAPFQVGDILWVRETWSEWTDGYAYKVPDNKAGYNYPASYIGKWKPSIHMPKEAARIFLRITDVRVERLRDISNNQAIKEGTENFCKICKKHDVCTFYKVEKYCYQKLWDSTIEKKKLDQYGWNANPWVWVIEFERCEKPVEREEK